MEIKKAQALKVGDMVRCPEDRGDPAYVGRVSHTLPNATVYYDLKGRPYIWVEVQNGTPKRKTVWPTNRLGRA